MTSCIWIEGQVSWEIDAADASPCTKEAEGYKHLCNVVPYKGCKHADETLSIVKLKW